VKPLAFVRTVTPPIFAVFRPTATASAAPEAELLPASELLRVARCQRREACRGSRDHQQRPPTAVGDFQSVM
jgi:hypothetical protein